MLQCNMVVGDKGSKGTALVVFRHERRSAFRNNEEGWIPGQDISGIVLRQAADGSGPPAGARIVALMDELGWAERAAVPTQRIAVLPDTVSFAAAAGRRPHRVAHVTARRTVARKARADHRRGRRGWSPRSAARCAFRCARHRGSGTAGAAGLRELGATDVVVGIEQAQGRFGLILESAGGASLATALHAVDANGAIVAFGNSSGEMTSISFADFRGGQNARLQSFSRSLQGRRNSLRLILHC
ncbi:MAG: hypothetical protein WBE71_02335 [Xanthobacteraceae bacterium]